MKFIVTGGGGFVGKALCQKLKSEGHQVVAIARGEHQDLLRMGVDLVRADLSQDPLAHIFKGAEAVFHTAAKVGVWGEYRDFYRHNVIATKNVLAACRSCGVNKLIFTSSPSVVHDGTNLRNIDETYPYPRQYLAHYPKTKALAEQAVLAANSPDLFTLSLRPHLIWGPGDRHLIPAIVKKGEAGRLFCIGRGENRVDVCYIDDCVQAHLKGYRALNNPAVRGRAYFISQGDPINWWDFVNKILAIHHLPPVKKRLPYPIAMGLATLMEWISKCLPGHPEPLLNRFLASELATDHYFNIGAARQWLGYEPAYTIAEALSHYNSCHRKK